jgi:hypothetical protein
MTEGRQAWLRCLSAGLVVLIATWALSLQVILMMSIGTLSATAMNVPAPKIAAAALLQRSIGNRAGELGVAGTLAVLGGLVGVWLISSPRHSGAGESLRLWLRWTAALTTGGALGLLLARTGIYLYDDSAAMLCLGGVVAGCELPTATLLYLYLRQVARDLGQTRSVRGLDLCVWLVPLGIAGATGLLILDAAQVPWGAARSGLYVAAGAFCVIAGLMATASVGRLTLSVGRVAFAGWYALGARALPRGALILGRIITAPSRDTARWSVVAGMAIWVAAMPGLINESLWQGARRAAGGDHPYVNFLAPKVSLAAVGLSRVDGGYPYRVNHHGVTFALCQLLAVWLMTRRDARQPEGRLAATVRYSARWWATLATSAIITASLLRTGRWGGGQPIPLKPSSMQILFVMLGEVPATWLLLWHLATVAARSARPRLSRQIRRVSIVAGTLIASPLGFFVVSTQGLMRYRSTGALVSGALLMAVELVVGLVALSALVRLAWALAAPAPSSPRLSSPAHDP